MSTQGQRSCCKHKKYTSSFSFSWGTKKSELRLLQLKREPIFLGKEWGGRQIIKSCRVLPQHYSSQKLSYSSHGINRGPSVRTVKRVHLERFTSVGSLRLCMSKHTSNEGGKVSFTSESKGLCRGNSIYLLLERVNAFPGVGPLAQAFFLLSCSLFNSFLLAALLVERQH